MAGWPVRFDGTDRGETGASARAAQRGSAEGLARHDDSRSRAARRQIIHGNAEPVGRQRL
jgi:hypothetical protein